MDHCFYIVRETEDTLTELTAIPEGEDLMLHFQKTDKIYVFRDEERASCFKALDILNEYRPQEKDYWAVCVNKQYDAYKIYCVGGMLLDLSDKEHVFLFRTKKAADAWIKRGEASCVANRLIDRKKELAALLQGDWIAEDGSKYYIDNVSVYPVWNFTCELYKDGELVNADANAEQVAIRSKHWTRM